MTASRTGSQSSNEDAPARADAPEAVPAPRQAPVQLPLPHAAPERRPAKGSRAARAKAWRIIAVGGGKGGIGKSLISANLGIELARRGRRVILIDADLGGANLHTCLGLSTPSVTLSDFMNRKVARIQDVAIPTGVANLSLVAGALDTLDVANPKHAQKLKLLRNLQAIDVDYAILDLGAGTSFNVLDFFLIADHGILVLVPEPTSVENGYRFLKAAFFRRLSTVQAVYGIEGLVQEAMSRRRADGIKSPQELIAAVKARDPESGENLEREMGRFRPRLVVNQARTPADREVGLSVAAAWRKYFGLDMDYLGALGYDDEIWKAVRRRRPLLVERPNCETALAFGRIADRLLQLDEAQDPKDGPRSR